MSIVASGMLTIVDINDSKQLQLYISANQPKTQIYDPNNGSYTPNWTSEKPVLTPQLFVAGTTTDVIKDAKSIKWFIDGVELTTSTADFTMATDKTSITINTNILANDNSKLFMCEVVYTDEDTEYDVTAKADIEFVKVSAGQDGETGASAIIGILSNDSHTIPTDSEGNNGVYGGAISTITIYEGATDVTDLWTVEVEVANVVGSLNGITYTVTSLDSDTGTVTFKATKDGSNSITKVFSLSKSRQGVTGRDGSNGIDGVSLYTWIKYADDELGNGLSDAPTGKAFLGIAYNQLTPTGTNDPTSYSWSKIEGDKGIDGERGDSGETYYTWIKYADDEFGNGFSDSGTDKAYLGISYNNLQQTESNNPSDYVWTRIKGQDGDQGIQGIAGVSSYTHIAYSNSADGTVDFSVSESDRNYIGIYVDSNLIDSTNPSDYRWTLVKGADGSQGIQGAKGEDGRTPYLHIAYANSVDGTVGFSTTESLDKEYIGQYTDFTASDSLLASDYKWTKIKGEQGIQGERGEQGLQGIQGEKGDQGIAGQDGISSYTHIAYANNATGTLDFSLSDSLNKEYIGMYVDTIPTDSTDSTKYKWTLIKGADGEKGIQGEKGADGQTPYLHIAYAQNDKGLDFSTISSVGRTWIGTYTDFIEEDSTDYTRYNWTEVKGEDGYTPIKGVDYFDGIDGQDGIDGVNGVSNYLHVRYSQNADGSSMTTDPANAKYIGIATTQSSTASTLNTDYRWSLIKGTDGINGEKGEDGNTSYLHIKYSNDGGATFTGNNGEDVGSYIGTYVDFTSVDSTDVVSYTWNKVKGEDGYTPIKGIDYFDGIDGQNGRDGVNGVDGSSSYLWIKYSVNSDGNPMTDSPSGAEYIGVAVTTEPIAPSTYTSYNWTLIKGTDGVKGENGVDGKTSYLHIKYSDDGQTFTANNGEIVGTWIGTYVDFTEADSTLFSSYTWNKIKGEQGLQGLQGEKGDQGIKGEDGQSSYTHIAYADSADGVTGFSVSDSLNKAYIGMYVDNTTTDSTDPTKYKWTLVKGADGAEGIAGKDGIDGKTPYLHIAYATNSTGTSGFSVTDSAGKTYIGQYTDFVQADSTEPAKYQWSLIKGADGIDGIDGVNGIDGQNATSYWLISSASVIQKDSNGVSTPASVTFDMKSQTGVESPKFYGGRLIISESTDSSTFTVKYTSSADESTAKAYTPSAEIKALKVEMFLAGGTSTKLDEEVIPVVSDGATGADSIVAVLDNDAHIIPTDSEGENGIYSNANTTLKIYEGIVNVTDHWSITAEPYNVVGYSMKNAGEFYYKVSNLTADSGKVTFKATRDGYSDIEKALTLVKSKQGSDITAYWLATNASVIKKTNTDTYVPASINLTAKIQVGSEPISNYLGRFRVYESLDGENYTAKYTSTVDEPIINYTPSAGIKAIKVQIYLAGGVSTLLDEQVIPIVEDGSDSVRAVVWTPNGNVIKNNTGTLTAQCDFYRGSEILTSGVTYQWYLQDPSVLSNEGGGIGWKKLTSADNLGTSGFTSNTLSIPADAIPNVESFKCVVTYNNSTYHDVCTVSDVSDPITVMITGTNVFKNGQGTTTLTAKLFQAGEEIDSAGNEGFTYTWFMYDENNAIDSTWNGTGSKVGKTIIVYANDITSRGNIICEATK